MTHRANHVALLAACRSAQTRIGGQRREFSLLSPPDIAQASQDHGVEDVALTWLNATSPDHRALATLGNRCTSMQRLHLRALADLRTLRNALDGAGVPFVIMKGPVLNELRTGSNVRRYSDLDVLVDPRNLACALDALIAAGASDLEGWVWQYLVDERHAQLPVALPLGTSVDLHWHLCSSPLHRHNLRFEEPAALLERSSTMVVGGLTVPVLSATDMLLHTAAHATWSGGHRLVWSVDIADIVRSFAIDWDELTERAWMWGAAELVGDGLRTSRDTVAADVPERVLDALGAGVWGKTIRLLSHRLMRPIPGTNGLARLMRQEMRGSTARNFALIAAHGRLALRSHRRGRPKAQPDSRERYFAFVEHEVNTNFNARPTPTLPNRRRR